MLPPKVREDCRGRFFTIGRSNLMVTISKIPEGSVAIADSIGRWGYVTNGVAVFPVQYDRTVETLVKYAGVRLNSGLVFADNAGCLFPVLSPTMEHRAAEFLTVHRHIDGWVFYGPSAAT